MTDRALVLGATFALSFAAAAKHETSRDLHSHQPACSAEERFDCPLAIAAEKACFDHFVVECAVAQTVQDAPIILPGKVIALKNVQISDNEIDGRHTGSDNSVGLDLQLNRFNSGKTCA